VRKKLRCLHVILLTYNGLISKVVNFVVFCFAGVAYDDDAEVSEKQLTHRFKSIV
jgi:hypothetical protein